ncbi:hypothetical protein Tco_1299774, partial [Tanacetum coccineum]
MAHIRWAIIEEHRASIEAYKKVHNETVRSGLRMEIVQQSMEMNMWEIKEKLAERREQMAIRSYEEDQRREKLNQKIEKLKNLIYKSLQVLLVGDDEGDIQEDEHGVSHVHLDT